MEWSKDDDTKTQCNRLNTSPLHRGNASNKNGPARVKRQMQWEVPSKPLVVDDPLLLPEREVHAEIGIYRFLDQEIPKGGYVRILAESLLWEERFGKTRISKQAKPKIGEKTDKKGGTGQPRRWKACWRQGNIKCAVCEEYASCWVHQDCHVADEQKAALKKAAGVSGGKDECQVRLKGRERDYWMGTEIGMLGGYGF